MKRNNNKKINKNLVDNLGAGGGGLKTHFQLNFTQTHLINTIKPP